MLKKMHLLAIVSIIEPFADSFNVVNFNNQLALDNEVTNLMVKFGYSRIVVLIVLLEINMSNKLPVTLITMNYKRNLP